MIRGYIGHYIECEWCGVRFVLPRAVPEGWFAIGAGMATRYCCTACAKNNLPEPSDE